MQRQKSCGIGWICTPHLIEPEIAPCWLSMQLYVPGELAHEADS